MKTFSYKGVPSLPFVHLRWHELSPDVSYVNHLACTPGYAFGPRTISDFQFIYVAAGTGSVQIQQNRYRAEAGDLYFYGPGIVHHFQADRNDPFDLYGIHFRWIAPLPDRGRLRIPQVVNVPDGEGTPNQPNQVLIGEHADSPDALLLKDLQKLAPNRFTERFSVLTESYQHTAEWAPQAMRALFTDLLISIQRALANGYGFPVESSERNLIRRIAEQLSAKADQKYDRSWLAEWTSYHPDHVSRLFRAGTGLTPYAYFMNRKLERAKKLLAETDESIGSIAERVGVGSIHTFSKWFKQMTGVSPLHYRRWSRFL
jgi:AraC-like DNA-binding protein